MRLEIRMPKLSEFSDEGAIAKWRVAVGDVVQKGEIVADVEVDMTTVALKAEADGKIAEIWVHAGQSVPVETVIAMQSVDADYTPEEEPAAEEEQQEPAEETSAEPDLSEEFPELGDEPPAAESAEATAPEPAPREEGAVVQNGHVLASPSAVQLAEQYNVNLETVTGTGSCGRIEREDVEASMQTSSQFITVEDVDDLMSFDGDFTSNFKTETESAESQAETASVGRSEEPAEETSEPIAEEQPESAIEEQSEETMAEESAGTDAEDEPEVEMAADEPADESVEEETPDTVAEEGSIGTEEESVPAASTENEETASTPDVIYMGEGPEPFGMETKEESTPEVETGTVVDQPEETEEPAADPVKDERPASEAEPVLDSAEAVDIPVPDYSAEPEALSIDESDTIGVDDLPQEEDATEEDSSLQDQAQTDAPEMESATENLAVGEKKKSVKVRRIIARKMVESWQNAPHFFVTMAVDMTDVIRFRTDLGVTINDFILAATTRALQEHPWVNSLFVDDEAVEQEEVNISLAVETEQGLFYPVVRNCGGKALKDIGLNAAEMVVKAHSGKLTEEEMDGGTFTISNMGMLGVESFGAIITPPQVAVLAVGTVKGEVVVDEHEEMVMAPMVRLTLSADHRALDGADAADFLGTIKSYLEAPITLVAPQES